MYLDELNLFFDQVSEILRSSKSLLRPVKNTLAISFNRWLLKHEIQELEKQLSIILKRNIIIHSKETSEYSINKCQEQLEARYSTKIGKDVFTMLLQHILCKEDYISRNVCKEAFRNEKIIDSTLVWVNKSSIEAIVDKLFSIAEDSNRRIYANTIAQELDAKLCVSFEAITELEKAGCKSIYLRRDINDFVRDLTSAFANFNIDFIEYLQLYKDFDPQFGNYELYRSLNFDDKNIEAENSSIQEERPEAKFDDYLIHSNKKGLMQTLHSLIDKKKCKDVTKVLIALEEASFLQKPSNAKLYASLLKEFDLDFSKSPNAMNDFLRERDTKYSKKEVAIIVNALLNVK